MEFVTADLHLGHENIIKYCNRPFDSIHHMNDVLIDNWNRKVGRNDIVYVLGDLVLGKKNVGLLERLSGKIILISGNHDWKIKKYKGFVNEIHQSMIIDDVFLVHNVVHSPFDQLTLCGHVHEKWKHKLIGKQCVDGHIRKSPALNVGVDHYNFSPIELEFALFTVRQLEEEDRCSRQITC